MWDPFQRACASRGTLDSLSDKWTVLIIVALADAPLRFSAIAQTVDGISDKVLTQRLHLLVELGLVERREQEKTPRITYALTELGYSARNVMAPLLDWTVAHMDQVLQARTLQE